MLFNIVNQIINNLLTNFSKLSVLKPISLIMIIFFIPIVFVSVIYAQEFEFNSEDYYDAEENSPNTNSEDQSTNTDSEDTDKEPCIDDQLESSAAVLSAVSDDSYTSNFHFVKKFDQNGNLVDSWVL